MRDPRRPSSPKREFLVSGIVPQVDYGEIGDPIKYGPLTGIHSM
jgi:hypothetical protein